MGIVVISEALLRRVTATDGRILRDRVLSGFCVRLNARKRTFLVATSVRGRQFRMMLGYWPLMSVDEARSQALEVLRKCRAGERPMRPQVAEVPTLWEAVKAYQVAKKIRQSSIKRYDSMWRTHFGAWLQFPVTALESGEIRDTCRVISQSCGAAVVEFCRGAVGALVRYVNAVHALKLESPFTRLAAAGLLPERAKPRARVLQEADLPAWRAAIDKLNERQRDYLLLALYTGLRRTECRELQRQHVDLTTGVLVVPMTKNGKAHTLPITPLMREILERRCEGLEPGAELFGGVSADHVSRSAMVVGAPRFMLHDLRKMLATVGQKMGISDAGMRRILNHTPARADVLHRHYVALNAEDVREPLVAVQEALIARMAGNVGEPIEFVLTVREEIAEMRALGSDPTTPGGVAPCTPIV